MHSFCRTSSRSRPGWARSSLAGHRGEASASTPGKAAAKAPPVQAQGEFAGSDTASLHEDKAASIKSGPCPGLQSEDAGLSAGLRELPWCGKAHAEAGGDKTKIASIKTMRRVR